ncbi:MAG: response regulator transcription factor [Paenibacillaceae bacterium]|nr:response regulator transcription factor [Paenibacillaceae bacterium]
MNERNQGTTILLAESGSAVRDAIVPHLDKYRFQLALAANGQETLRLYEEALPELVLLDSGLMLPDGLGVCERLRSYSNVPIVMFGEGVDPETVVRCFELGADDFVPVPFEPAVLPARLAALLRRAPIYRRLRGDETAAVREAAKLTFGNLAIDVGNYEVTIGGENITFSAKEMQLLIFLAQNPDHIFTLEDLYTKVWGAESNGDLRTVMVHLSNIRKKIEPNPVKPRWIHNVRGFGYKFSSRHTPT